MLIINSISILISTLLSLLICLLTYWYILNIFSLDFDAFQDDLMLKVCLFGFFIIMEFYLLLLVLNFYFMSLFKFGDLSNYRKILVVAVPLAVIFVLMSKWLDTYEEYGYSNNDTDFTLLSLCGDLSLVFFFLAQIAYVVFMYCLSFEPKAFCSPISSNGHILFWLKLSFIFMFYISLIPVAQQFLESSKQASYILLSIATAHIFLSNSLVVYAHFLYPETTVYKACNLVFNILGHGFVALALYLFLGDRDISGDQGFIPGCQLPVTLMYASFAGCYINFKLLNKSVLGYFIPSVLLLISLIPYFYVRTQTSKPARSLNEKPNARGGSYDRVRDDTTLLQVTP